MDVPDVLYARSGEVAIAYQVIGEGPVDLVFVRGVTGDLLSTWDQPLLVRHVIGLAAFSRVLMLDKRGTGLSDRTTALPTLETRMDDLRAVMDAAGSERAVLWSAHEGSRLAALFGATYPDRTIGLVLFDPAAARTPRRRLSVGADRSRVAGAPPGDQGRVGDTRVPGAPCCGACTDPCA